jgi:histidinol-phosphatase
MTEPKQSKELGAALEAASAAAEVIRALYRPNLGRDLPVNTKSDNSPVTEADVRAEQSIRAVLERHFPAYGFYGEEGGRHAMNAECIWLVDPLDGT